MFLGIYGSGGCGREFKDIAETLGTWKKIIFIDDTVDEGIYLGCKRIPFKRFLQEYDVGKTEIVIAQGEPEFKTVLYDRVREKGYSFANLIHSASYVSPSAKLGRGIVIEAGAFVSCNTVIQDNTHILPGAIIGHDCMLHKHCQLSPGCILGGNVILGEGVFIGIHASVKEKVKIGSETIIGMGAAVFEDIPDNIISVGNPARPISRKNGSRVFENDAIKSNYQYNELSILEKYDCTFVKCFGVKKEQLSKLKYKAISAWDSLGHMQLIAELESEFGIVLESEDILDFSSYEKGKEILNRHYGVEF